MRLFVKLIEKFKALLLGQKSNADFQTEQESTVGKGTTPEPISPVEQRSRAILYGENKRENALKFADEINNDLWLDGQSG